MVRASVHHRVDGGRHAATPESYLAPSTSVAIGGTWLKGLVLDNPGEPAAFLPVSVVFVYPSNMVPSAKEQRLVQPEASKRVKHASIFL